MLGNVFLKLKQFFHFAPLGDRTFTAIILALIAIIITYSTALARFDNLHYDLGRYFTFKPAPKDIVIIAIDEASLSKLGRWPWSRTVHADLINKLTIEQAKVIGLDLIFAEPELTNPKADIALALAIKQAGNVVLPHLLENAYAVETNNPLVKNAAALGRVRVPLDLDGMARSIYLWEGYAGGALNEKQIQHFSQAVLQVAKQLPLGLNLQAPNSLIVQTDFALTAQQFISQDIKKIKFLGQPNHFQRISYAEVLVGHFPVHFFQNKIVLIGATAAGLGDVLPTPVSALSQPMPGIEFHANAIASMRNGTLIDDAPLWLSSLLCVALAIVPLIFLPRLSPLKSLLFIVAYYFLIMLLAITLPRMLNLWIPPAGALIAILLAYPIWSWRKLESAQAYLDKALKNLQAEIALMGLDKANLQYANAQDEMQTRIAKVELTSQYLRDAQQKRVDTLAFISHDIRAPLAAAMMQLEASKQDTQSTHVKQMLNRALNMADEFLQSSRAEMADTAKFNDIEMVGLVQQALDDVYHVAQIKRIKITTHVSDDSLWVKGDFGLLQRAITNILSNAVKYSQQNTIVQMVMRKVDQQLVLEISDTGPGIPAEKLNKLFKRFSRVEGEYQLPVGTGLGLYFVEITVQKHSGHIFVESKLGEGAKFSIILPLIN